MINNNKYTFEQIINIISTEPFKKRTFCGILKSKYPQWLGFNYIGKITSKAQPRLDVELKHLIELAANFWFFNQNDFNKRYFNANNKKE